MAEPAGGGTDAGMAPVDAGEEERLEVFTATAAAKEYVQKRRAREGLRRG
jgi:hypothetical protein